MRLAREAKGWRLEDLALKVGRAKSVISYVEHGYVPREWMMERLAAALDTTPQELFPDDYCGAL